MSSEEESQTQDDKSKIKPEHSISSLGSSLTDIEVTFGTEAIPNVTFTHSDWSLIFEVNTKTSELILQSTLG